MTPWNRMSTGTAQSGIFFITLSSFIFFPLLSLSLFSPQNKKVREGYWPFKGIQKFWKVAFCAFLVHPKISDFCEWFLSKYRTMTGITGAGQTFPAIQVARQPEKDPLTRRWPVTCRRPARWSLMACLLFCTVEVSHTHLERATRWRTQWPRRPQVCVSNERGIKTWKAASVAGKHGRNNLLPAKCGVGGGRRMSASRQNFTWLILCFSTFKMEFCLI